MCVFVCIYIYIYILGVNYTVNWATMSRGEVERNRALSTGISRLIILRSSHFEIVF